MEGGAVGVDHANELLAFADAAIAGDTAALADARETVVTILGEAAMIDAAGVIAGFNGITRIADATGIPLEETKAEQTAAWRDGLGIDEFQRLKS